MQGNIKKILTKNNINYALLSYIESTGTQSIRLGNSIPFNTDNTIIECDFQYTQIATDSGAKWLWSNQGSSGNMTDFYSQVNSDTRGFFLRPSASQAGGIGINIQHDTNKHHLKVDFINKKFYYDDNVYNMSHSQSSQTASMYLFRRANQDTGYAKIKLFNFKYTRTVHHDYDFDLVPVERLSDGVVGLLNLVDGSFLTNAGSGTFVKGDYLVEHLYKTHITKDNEEVIECEYIQSSGTQWINTNFTPTLNSKVEIDLKTLSLGSSWDIVFYTGTPCQCSRDGSSSNFAFYLGGSKTSVGSFTANTNYSIILDGKNSKATINGTNYTLSKGSGRPTGKMTLLCQEGSSVTKAQLFKAKIYDNDELKQNLIPVKVVATNEYCMLDLVENKLYHNAGTGTFTGGNLIELQKLEEVIISNNTMYYKLDYLQSSGTQYINTGYKPNNKTKAFLNVELIGISGETNYPAIFGSRTSNHFNDTFMACRNNAANQIRVEMGNAKYGNFNYSANTRYNLEFNYQYVKVNGTQYTTGQTSFPQSNQNIFLFGLNQGGALDTQYGKFIQKLYGARFEEDDVKLNLIPAERVSDNAKGMLDTLSGTFYTNSGSGTFAGNRKQIILVE